MMSTLVVVFFILTVVDWPTQVMKSAREQKKIPHFSVNSTLSLKTYQVVSKHLKWQFRKIPHTKFKTLFALFRLPRDEQFDALNPT